ncbi:MAG: hypothetical protein M0R51_13650 [Clostridia bacterium]|jgi:hypothetical protein|nr:hypothetical protein [Clostridia bacterium]
MYIGVDLDGEKFYIRKGEYNDFLDMLKIKDVCEVGCRCDFFDRLDLQTVSLYKYDDVADCFHTYEKSLISYNY